MAHQPPSKSSQPVAVNELCEIRALALLKLISHALRFWKENAKPGENQCVYGFLVGSITDQVRLIKDIEPILHQSTPDFDFNEKFISDMDAFNNRYVEEESSDRIIGWYKSTNIPVKYKALDVKNQLKFQTLHKKNIGLIIDPEIYMKGDSYGFGVFTLMIDRYGDTNIMSDHVKIPWEVKPLGESKDITIQFMKDLINKSVLGKVLLTEVEEDV
jgi:hypothetical protein